jgi:hypothetical protein
VGRQVVGERDGEPVPPEDRRLRQRYADPAVGAVVGGGQEIGGRRFLQKIVEPEFSRQVERGR